MSEQELTLREIVRELEAERKKTEALKKNIEDIEDRFDDYVEQQRKEESRRLRTALIWAGGVILALGSFIFSEIIWPVIKAGRP